jgi:hypothetical protein
VLILSCQLLKKGGRAFRDYSGFCQLRIKKRKKIRGKCLEDDIHKEQLKAERKAQEAVAESNDKTSY